MELIKKEFKEAMLVLYPNKEVDIYQLRDLIRTFAMGWVSALGNNGQNIEHLCEFTFTIMERTWYPDESWKWF